MKDIGILKHWLMENGENMNNRIIELEYLMIDELMKGRKILR